MESSVTTQIFPSYIVFYTKCFALPGSSSGIAIHKRLCERLIATLKNGMRSHFFDTI